MRTIAAFIVFALAMPVAAGCASGGNDADTGRDVRIIGSDVPSLDAPMGSDTPASDTPVAGDTPMPDTPPPMTDAPSEDTPAADTPMVIMRDSGSDAPVRDVPGIDVPPPECMSAGDCNDGIVCNGTERCELGMCVNGPPPACDDGVACTVDACVGSGCTYTPMDSLCGGGMRCTSTGCVPSTGCSETPCRLVPPQCGCAMGQSCILNGATRMCGVAGFRSEGEACTAVGDCASGLACVNFSAGPPAQMCVRMCGSDVDCVGGGRCLNDVVDGTGMTIPGVRLCTRACNPVAQTGCAPGLFCGVYATAPGATTYVTDCAGPVGSGTSGAACTSDTNCAAGFLCIDVDGFGPTCNHWCNAVTGAGCTGGRTCYGFMTPVVVSGVEYGVCAF